MKSHTIKFLNSITLSVFTVLNLIFAIVNRTVWHDWNISIITIIFASAICALVITYNSLYYQREQKLEKQIKLEQLN